MLSSRQPAARGIALMLIAVASFALMDAALKWLARELPPFQLAAIRGAASLPLVLGWVIARRRLHTLWRVRWPLHLARGALGVAMMAGFTYGVARLSLAEAYALFFIAPLLITALAALLLREALDRARLLAIAGGFVGVLVVLRPGGGGLASLAGLAVLGAATAYAVSAITVRVLARSDSTEATVFWMLALMTPVAALLAAPDWRPIAAESAPAIAVVGIGGAVGQWAITRAFALAPASTLAPFEYTALVWGVALDALLWHAAPDGWAIGGGLWVAACGLWLLRRETRALPAQPGDSPP